MSRPCRCGHDEQAHEHYRPGSDCAACGRDRCRAYRPRRGLRALVERWQVGRDDRLLNRLATGRPPPGWDRLARLLAAWRDENRPDEENRDA